MRNHGADNNYGVAVTLEQCYVELERRNPPMNGNMIASLGGPQNMFLGRRIKQKQSHQNSVEKLLLPLDNHIRILSCPNHMQVKTQKGFLISSYFATFPESSEFVTNSFTPWFAFLTFFALVTCYVVQLCRKLGGSPYLFCQASF